MYKLNSRAQWIELYVWIFFSRGTVLLVLTQLVSFRFRIHGILTTNPWSRANPLDTVYKFDKLLPMQLGQIPYNETEKSSIGQCYPGGIPHNGPYGKTPPERGNLFHASGIWRGHESKYIKG